MLKNLIERKRNKMMHTAKEYGLHSNKTIQLSQELDKLIAQYQKLMKSI